VTCQEFIDFMLDYDNGTLPAEQRARFDEHLAICPDCVNYLASYRASVAMGKSAFRAASDPLPTDVPQELVQAILAACRHAR
jgi:anti-sigma factor RsiW